MLETNAFLLPNSSAHASQHFSIIKSGVGETNDVELSRMIICVDEKKKKTITHHILLEVDERSGCYLSNEDQQEAGEVLKRERCEMTDDKLIQTYVMIEHLRH